MINSGAITSSGSVSSTELSSIATTVSSVVMPAITDFRQAEAHALAHRADVPGHPGDQVAGARALHPAQRQPEHGPHDVLACLGQQVLAEDHRRPQREEGQDRLHHDDAGHRQRQPVQRRGESAAGRGRVDQRAEDARHDQTGDRRQGMQHQQRGDHPAPPARAGREVKAPTRAGRPPAVRGRASARRRRTPPPAAPGAGDGAARPAAGCRTSRSAAAAAPPAPAASAGRRQVSAEPRRPVCSSVIGLPPQVSSSARATDGDSPGCVCSSSSCVPYADDRLLNSNATRSAWCSSSGDTVVTIVVRPAAMRDQPLGDQRLGVRVHRRRRLDQDQDLRVEPERPSQHHPLTLAAGQPAAALVDPTLPAAGQAVEDVLGRSGVQRRLGLRQAQPAVRIDRCCSVPANTWLAASLTTIRSRT